MPITVYDRLIVFYENNNHPLDQLQKVTLGRSVAKAWYGQSNRNQFKDFLSRKTIQEDTGSYKVLFYPDYFASEIDRLIGDFYASLAPKKRVRKLKAVEKVWSSKPTPDAN